MPTSARSARFVCRLTCLAIAAVTASVAAPLAHAQTTTLAASLSGTTWNNTATLATGSGLALNLGLAVNYIIVGGGGGGGGGANGPGGGGGGGGGGGNVSTGVFAASPQAYALTVGGGGAGGAGSVAATARSGTAGESSSIFSLTALGGSGGGPGSNTGTQTTLAGDGGGSGRTASGAFTATSGGANNFDGAGGGAGANANGSNGTDISNNGGIGGAGGDGVLSSITGGRYGGGGGGGGSWRGSGSTQNDGGGGAGGSGGGGAGAQLPGTVADGGTNGLGGGGGGGGYTNGSASTAGASGGSGAVIVAYPTQGSTIATGGSVTTTGGNTIHSFTSGVTSGITSSLTFSFDTSVLDAEVSGVISGTGALTYAGAGTLTLSAANTYSGGTIVNSGSLIARSTLANAASNTLTTNAGGTFIFDRTDVFANHSGTVLPTIVVNQGGTVRNASGNFNALGAVTLNGGTLDSAGFSSASGVGFALKGTVAVTGSTIATISGSGIGLGAAAVASTTFNVADGAAATDLLVSGVLRDGPAPTWPNSQTSSLVKTGTGTMVLAGANTYTGSTTISAGTLRVGAGGTAGTLGSGAVINNAALAFDRSDAFDVANAISGSGSLGMQGAGTLTLSGTNSYSGGTTVSAGRLVGTTDSLQGAITNSAAVEFAQVTSGTYIGNMSGSGSLTKSGAGGLTLTGSNSFSGGAALNAGTLALGSADALGATGTISFVGGTLQYSAANTTDYSGRFSTAAGQLYAIDTNGQNVSLATALASSGGSLTKSGLGTLTLSDSNSYSGGTVVSAGRLVGTTDSLQGGITNNAAVEFAQTTSGSYAGNMSGSGSFTKTGAGAVTLSGSNSFSGGTTISAGTLAVGSANALGSAGTISFGGGTLQYSAANTTDYSARFSTAAGQQVAIDTNGQNVSLATALTSIGGSLTKTGTGNLILAGTSSYTGATSVAAGRLSVNGILGNSPVAVLAAAELGGSGSIAGPVSVAGGGTLAPGNSIASLATGTATFAAGATFAYEVDSTDLNALGTAADLLVVSGNLDLDTGNATRLTFADIASSPNAFVEDTTIFALVNYSGSWNGGLFTYGSNVLSDGERFTVGSQWWEIDYNSSTGGANFTSDYLPSSSFVTVTAVPEPATLALLGIGAVLVAVAASRRRDAD